MRRLVNPRGNAMLMSLVVVLVITAAGIATVRFASREVAGAYAMRKGATLDACAETARALLMSQWKLLGTYAQAVPPVSIVLETASQTTIRGGHYDQDPSSSSYWTGQSWVNNVQVVPLNPLTVGGAYQVNDITNRIADMAQPYRVVVHCTQADGRETEVEFAVQWGL